MYCNAVESRRKGTGRRTVRGGGRTGGGGLIELVLSTASMRTNQTRGLVVVVGGYQSGWGGAGLGDTSASSCTTS